MSNGIVLRTCLLTLLASFLLVGCARDRATTTANLAPTQHEHIASSGSPASVPPASGLSSVGQKFCPVTGEPLDSMGGAIPVTAMGETIYVCCKGCVKSVNKNPEKYLAIVRAES